mgnify:CR=1 FL=1
MIHDYEVNKIYKDEFGAVSGVFVYNKPVGITSHDAVYKFRKHLGTKKVGHAGTLDPFADGILVILAGKATKLSDKLLNKDKEYIARVLLGVETNSGDPEGDITESINSEIKLDLPEMSKVMERFKSNYIQSVPLFSSVKVKGRKLRELAREYSSFKIESLENKKIVSFYKDNEIVETIELPSKEVNIYNYEITNSGVILKEDILKAFKKAFSKKEINPSLLALTQYNYIDIRLHVSKGTYIRQFAVDLGKAIGLPSMLLNLKRTKVGEFSLDNVYDL